MPNQQFKRGFDLRKALVVLSLVLILGYGVFNARNILLGPSIEVFEPASNVETGKNLLLVKGRARNITYLSLNDRPISVNTSGVFEEKLLLSPGFNTIRIYARDRFSQDTEKQIRIYYKENIDYHPAVSIINSKNIED